MARKKLQYQICVSGAARGESAITGAKLAAAAGREIARRGHITLTGATKGLPYEAAKAAQTMGGISMGFSPAASRLAHIKKYRLPLDAFDAVLFTGFEYTGRNLLLIRSSDAVVMVGGRIGTLNELTIAIEERKPIGVLLGSGGMTEEVEHVLKAAKRARTGIIFSHDPADLVDQLIDMIKVKARKIPEDIMEN
ncbi:LOG family protein [Candidatus Saccharibacteria bacterium]|nr:LOG family protein [Candidatus Saccharibacteria bacterium]